MLVNWVHLISHLDGNRSGGLNQFETAKFLSVKSSGTPQTSRNSGDACHRTVQHGGSLSAGTWGYKHADKEVADLFKSCQFVHISFTKCQKRVVSMRSKIHLQNISEHVFKLQILEQSKSLPSTELSSSIPSMVSTPAGDPSLLRVDPSDPSSEKVCKDQPSYLGTSKLYCFTNLNEGHQRGWFPYTKPWFPCWQTLIFSWLGGYLYPVAGSAQGTGLALFDYPKRGTKWNQYFSFSRFDYLRVTQISSGYKPC